MTGRSPQRFPALRLALVGGGRWSLSIMRQAMKLGAQDYLLNPFDPEQLMLLTQKLARHRAVLNENALLRERPREGQSSGWGDLLAASPAMRRVLDLVQELASSESPVLITGETGTGKEMVARALHAAGPRGCGHCVPINCGALTNSLLESALFGHERGAFTGAVKARRGRRGRLELASGGTLFLDEVGEISPGMQVDLLRVLEEKSPRATRPGSDSAKRISYRLVRPTTQEIGP